MTLDLRFQPYRLFPYERDLARREVNALGLEVVAEAAGGMTARGRAQTADLERLTYFQAVNADGVVIEPDSARFERRHLERRSLPRSRQATRYLVHGLHEYKGKFHPQLVRAFANLLGVEPDDTVLDPFCGSGTTLVEASLLRARAVGLDLSPIAVLIAQAKLAVLASADRGSLLIALQSWVERVLPLVEAAYRRGQPPQSSPVSSEASTYLARWFNPSAYAGLVTVLAALEDLGPGSPEHVVASVAVSSVLREASEQAPEDLRIRRRVEGRPAAPLPDLLRDALSLTLDAVRETADADYQSGPAEVHLGDATSAGAFSTLVPSPQARAGRMAVITSPPYATALPYIDTDRLSLVALGLAEPSRLATLEGDLIGSREWRAPEATRWWGALRANADDLPDAVTALGARLESDEPAGAGFRRKNVPALLYRYFSEMKRTFVEIRGALRPGEAAVFVVGVNRTSTEKGQTVIETPRLLAEVAMSVGFDTREVIELETWPRYSLHQGNAVQGESAVVLEAT